MNITKTTVSALFAVAAISAFAATTPEVTAVSMSQASDSRLVTITYTLGEAPAVVTLDVQTNATANAPANDPGWTSIGGEAVWNAMGDVWKQVETGDRTIEWRPDLSWPDHKIADGCARAVVTAYALDNTPDYMVVDLAAANTRFYYPSVDFLPGSAIGQTGTITNNLDYKTTKLVMRKIMASGVRWTMGSADGETQRNANEAAHAVTLTNNYYIGVFEVTQSQWKNIATNSAAAANFTADWAKRPMEKVCYNEIRLQANSDAAATPLKDPAQSSFLGLLRLKTGLDFDLPSEAQWEFAARAGHGSGYWNNGTLVGNTDTDNNLKNLGRYVKNASAGIGATPTTAPSVGGTAIVGSYVPSDWGLYDMHGNAWEWCLDWYAENITEIGGKVNIDPNNLANTLSGTPVSGANRVIRGGSWYNAAGNNRPAFRNSVAPTSRSFNIGFRVVCTAGLK